MKPMLTVLSAVFLVLALSVPACQNQNAVQNEADNALDVQAELIQAAERVLEAFKSENGDKLAAFVHPEKGVRFSTSAYVDVDSDLVFSAGKIRNFWNDEHVYTWGYADGTGDPIELTPRQYCIRYVLDRDFLNSDAKYINYDRIHGNTTNNAASVYPNTQRIEFYIEPRNVDKSDWAALRLVLEKFGGDWFLVGVIHDEWSI